jgi:restriction system protein
MLPLMRLVENGQEHRIRDLIPTIADQVGLTTEQREAMLPSGQQTILSNRVGWAKTYLKKAGLLSNATRGSVRITELGLRVLAESPQQIDVAFLRNFEPFEEFIRTTSIEPAAPTTTSITDTPEEDIEAAYGRLRDALVDDVLDRMKTSSPSFLRRWTSTFLRMRTFDQ